MPALVVALLGLRMLGSAVEIIDDSFREWDRSVAEHHQKNTVREKMKAKKALLEKLIELLEDPNGQYNQLLFSGDALLRVQKLRQLKAHRREVQIVLGYEFCLLSELNDPDHPDQPKAPVDGKFYLDTNGDYCVLDPNGNVQRGRLPATINISQVEGPGSLVEQLKDKSFTDSILKITAENNHTFNIQAGARLAKVPRENILTNLILKLGNIVNRVHVYFRPLNPAAAEELVGLIPDADAEARELEAIRNYIIPDGESSWSVINDLTFRMALGSYLTHYERLSAYDKQLLFSTLRQATNGDATVNEKYQRFISANDDDARRAASLELSTEVENVLKRRITRPSLHIGLRLGDYIGTGLLAAATGMGVIFSSAGLISLLVPVFMPAVCIAALVGAVVFAVSKVAYEVYKERKHEKINKAINAEDGRHGQVSVMNNLMANAKQLSLRPVPAVAAPVAGAAVVYQDSLSSIEEPTAEIVSAGAL